MTAANLDHPAMLALGASLVLAVVAWVMDYRRARRSDLDRVGLMPWTQIFFVSLIAALILTGLALREWLQA